MSSGTLGVVIAAIGSAITIGTIVFLAGAMKGAVSARLDNIETRLTEIEHSLRRLGFTFRSSTDDA